ncbi:MAG: hypothetical protein MPK62_12365, partial [Alphaproteobacteria bacterium]|nr:hypothetical protein [Alphaproteobacteria bacterium]
MSDKNYDIASFWQPLLSSTARGTSNVQGWEHVTDEFEAFWPAPIVPLEISDLDTARPDNAKIFLISSPGAVGKTTLARQLARVTGAMLVNLAKTLPVGAHTLTGGISKTDLEEKFKQGEISLIVDGLDEGRIHTQSGETFEAFIKDVADLVKDNAECKPIVLLGRSLAVKDTLVALNLEEVSPAVFQIDYYDVENAAKFVELQIAVKNKKEGERVDLASITQPQKEAIGLYLKALQALVSKVRTLQSTQSFAGYSPVLMAVAESVSDAANVQKLVNQLEKGDESASLNSIARSILPVSYTHL